MAAGAKKKNSNRGLLQHCYNTEVAGESLKQALQTAFRKCVPASMCTSSQVQPFGARIIFLILAHPVHKM